MSQSKALTALTPDDLIKAGVETESYARELLELIREIYMHTADGPAKVWRRVSKEVLTPEHPFSLHQLLLSTTFSGWDAAKQGPVPVWSPTAEGAQDTNLARFMSTFQGDERWRRERSGDPLRDYDLLHRVSYESPEAFWPPMLQQLRIRFQTPPTRMLQEADNPDESRWLPGARLNIAESVLEGRDQDAEAVVWAEEASPQEVHSLTWGQLRWQAYRVASALQALGLAPGDAVAIYMPMTVDTVAMYFGTILAGCAVVSVADSFAPAELATRLRLVNTRAIFTQDVILRGGKALPLYARVLEARGPRAIVLPSTPAADLQVPLRPGDVDWADFLTLGGRAGRARVHVADAYETTNILFSSGTTGEPKAIPWSHVTPLRSGLDGWGHQDIRRGDVVAWPTNLGWMMGPWLLYAALLNGAAVALFQGSPLGRPFGLFVRAARVSMLGLVPSIAKAWRASGCMAGIRWPALRCLSSSGEASAPEDYHWLMALAGYVPVIEYCGGTELGGGYCCATLLQPQSPSHFSTPTLGTRIAILGPSGEQSVHGSGGPCIGEVAIVPPMLGMSQRLLNRNHYEVYYKDMPRLHGTGRVLRRHGDEVERLPRSYYTAHGRVDDTMNLGGIKVSSVELERACVQSIPCLAEAAAVGLPAPGGGPEQLVLFLVTSPEAPPPQELKRLCQEAIRTQLNPLFKVERVVLQASLPRTASNKVMRRVLRDSLRTPQPRL